MEPRSAGKVLIYRQKTKNMCETVASTGPEETYEDVWHVGTYKASVEGLTQISGLHCLKC
jgi:hypothetical protein